MVLNSDEKYGGISKLLHWIIALAMIFLIALGWYMTTIIGKDYYNPWYNKAPELHKVVGLALLAVVLLKLTWTAITPLPHLPREIGPLERGLAWLAHKALYILMIVLPVTGYVIATSKGAPVDFYGLFKIPALLPGSEKSRALAEELHYYGAYGGAALIALHFLAALKHQFNDGIGVLRRMF